MKDMYNKALYDIGKCLLAVAFATAILVLIFGDSWMMFIPGCIFKMVTGMPCMGCGGTRAINAMLHGHIIDSLKYHPLIIYATIVYVVFMFKMFLLKHYNIGREHKGLILIFVYIGIGIIVIQWIVKLVLLRKYGIEVV